MDTKTLKELAEAGDWTGLAKALVELFPQGLVGEREALVTFLVTKVGLPHKDAVKVARALELEGYAHHLPGERPRWIFTHRPVDLRDLMRMLDQEYKEFIGEGDENPREAALRFITKALNVDRKVAEEVLEGLTSAGYAQPGYSPEAERDLILFKFPEAFLMTYRI